MSLSWRRLQLRVSRMEQVREVSGRGGIRMGFVEKKCCSSESKIWV